MVFRELRGKLLSNVGYDCVDWERCLDDEISTIQQPKIQNSAMHYFFLGEKLVAPDAPNIFR